VHLQAGHRRWIGSTIGFSANASWTQRQRYPQWGFNFKIGDLLNVPGFFKPDLTRWQLGGIRNIRSSTAADSLLGQRQPTLFNNALLTLLRAFDAIFRIAVVIGHETNNDIIGRTRLLRFRSDKFDALSDSKFVHLDSLATKRRFAFAGAPVRRSKSL
jgi:hypothetical protein